MERIKQLIIDNPNIAFSLKGKIYECASLIINEYPNAYKGLCNNLENLNIKYINGDINKILNSIGAMSLYDGKENTMYISLSEAMGEHYKDMLIHELLHVSSKEDDRVGFEDLYSDYGKSLNEGLTEYMTRRILKNNNFGMLDYKNDMNNIGFISNIVPLNILIDSYFERGLPRVVKAYYDKIGNIDNIEEILKNMDLDHIERVRNHNFNNKYKDTYIKLLVSELANIKPQTETEVIKNISSICGFIRGQYKVLGTPLSIKEDIENSINIINNNYKKINKNYG